MKHSTLIILAALYFSSLNAQTGNRFSVEINYGLNGNFFVIDPEYGGPGGPSGIRFYQKNFIGPIGGAELTYNLSKHSRLGIAYARSVNSKEINFSGTVINAEIENWRITHTNKFHQLFYERDFSKKMPSLKYHVGLFYLLMNQQEIEIGDFVNGGISFEERSFENSKLEEGGAFLGIHYSKKIDTKFELGIKSRLYYLISIGSLEAVTITPTLTYHF